MGAIGIGSALSALPQGILQGEEIARRREREDEAARMAKAEFENRQTIFGRQKQEWGKSDAVDDATAAYLASAQTDADKETMYAKMAAAKAGGMALQTKGVLTQQRAAEQNIDLSAKSFDLQSQQHAEAMKKARRENLQQEIQMTLLGETWLDSRLAHRKRWTRLAQEPKSRSCLGQQPRMDLSCIAQVMVRQ